MQRAQCCHSPLPGRRNWREEESQGSVDRRYVILSSVTPNGTTSESRLYVSERPNRPSPLVLIFTVSFSGFGQRPEQSGSRLHHVQRRDGFRSGGPQVPEPAYSRQESCLKGPHRLVESGDRSCQGSPQGLEMIPENRSALVHLLSEVTDLTRAFGELLLPPAVGHRFEQSH